MDDCQCQHDYENKNSDLRNFENVSLPPNQPSIAAPDGAEYQSESDSCYIDASQGALGNQISYSCLQLDSFSKMDVESKKSIHLN